MFQRIRLLTALPVAYSLFVLVVFPIVAPTQNGEEVTCTIDPSNPSDCSKLSNSIEDTASMAVHDSLDKNDLSHRVVTLTDDTFDELTWTSQPSTWLIMFQTAACGICQKTKPELDALARDEDILNHNNHQQSKIGETAYEKHEVQSMSSSESPIGSIYIATMDVNWSGLDTSKRFGIEATPTLLVVRNEGYDETKYKLNRDTDGTLSLYDVAHGKKMNNMDPRSYYFYHGQRAKYPLKSFVLGAFLYRKRLDLPPPLSNSQRKPQRLYRQIYYYFLPQSAWTLSIVMKLFFGWFVCLGILGIFLRVHNYAWGDEDDEKLEDEKEKAVAKCVPLKNEKKGQNARPDQKVPTFPPINKKTKKGGVTSTDDDFVGVGVSVKKSQVTNMTERGIETKTKNA